MSVPLGREAIWSKFFALLSALQAPTGQLPSVATPFSIVSRRAILWEQTEKWQPGPALYLFQHREIGETKERGKPTKWYLHANLYVYALNADQSLSGGQILNPLIDAVEGALAPKPVEGNVLSLGGLVSRAYIEGPVEVAEGNIDNIAVAVIPVVIIAPV